MEGPQKPETHSEAAGRGCTMASAKDPAVSLGFCRSLGGPWEDPRGSQGGPRGVPGGPKGVPGGPKRAQGGPKWSQDGPR